MLKARRFQAQAAETGPLPARLGVRRVGQGIGRGRKSVEVGVAVGPAQRPVNRNVRGDGEAAANPRRGRGEAVGFRIAAGLIRRRDAVGSKLRDPGPEAVAPGRDPRRQPAPDRVERPRLQPGREAIEVAGGEGDHPANGVRAPQGRLRPGQHLDPFDIRQVETREVEGAVDLGRVIDRHAIDQNEGLARRGPAHPNLGDPAERARPDHRQAGKVTEDVGGEGRTALIEDAPVDHPRARRSGNDGRQPGGGDDHLGQGAVRTVGRPAPCGHGQEHGRGHGIKDVSRHDAGLRRPALALRGGV